MSLRFGTSDSASDSLAVIAAVPPWIQVAFIALVVAMIWFVAAGLRGKRCLYCRKRNRPGAVYCAECGHRLDKPPKKLE